VPVFVLPLKAVIAFLGDRNLLIFMERRFAGMPFPLHWHSQRILRWQNLPEIYLLFCRERPCHQLRTLNNTASSMDALKSR
jgi:hypothetical protein